MPELHFTDAELDHLADALAPRIEARVNHQTDLHQAAYSPRTLAAELGRSERSIRAAIHRGELGAVWRGRGWVIGADAVAAWTHPPGGSGPRRPGPMARALEQRRPG